MPQRPTLFNPLYHWGSFSRGYTGPSWKVTCDLPGAHIKPGIAFANEADAKVALEGVVKRWFAKAMAE